MRSPIFKRLAVISLAALLLIVGYYWYRAPVTSTSPVVIGEKSPTPEATIVPDTTATDTVPATDEAARKKPVVTHAPTLAPRPAQPADRPATSEREPAPAEAAEKPTPPACDQLVMRDGDLIDAKILAVGVNEIRYRRCRREDGPEYVVSKADVLSIRYASGDIDRF